MAKAPAVGSDPLVAAMIAKLPAAGSAWPTEARHNWLRMMSMTFDLVYGGSGGAALDLPSFLKGDAPQGAAPAAAAAPAPVAAKPPPPGPEFYIDELGHARRDGGDAILPDDLGGEVIYDKRGEHGDLGSIVWADGTRGVVGLRLNISAIF